MRVGLNGHLLGKGGGYRRAGLSHYVERLVRDLPRALHDDDELVVYAARGVDRSNTPDAVRWRLSPLPTEHPAVRIGWEQMVLPAWTARDQLDVFHGTVNVLPLASGTPAVLTIHDVAFLRLPDRLSARRRRYLETATRASARRARRVIAVSESTRDDVVQLLDIPSERVVVIPLAADESYQPAGEAALAAFRAEHDLAVPYLLYVGTLEPRKNVPALLRAFATLADSIPHQIVLVGAEGWMTDELHRTIAQLKLGDRLRLTGYVPSESLPLWYSAADVFAFPSSYEGFGLPPLEAMACGTPVVASTVSSLPEVVGDAALSVHPDDIDGLAAAIGRVLGDDELRGELRRRGLARAATFSWARTARETGRVYHEVADQIPTGSGPLTG
ncbi:MAG: glycosyltransferase family 1 protein [Pseudonocardiales bacterium]